MKRTVPTAAACLALAAALTACGERSEPTGPAKLDRATVVLAGKPQPADLCLFQARAAGQFRQAGLEVTLLAPASAAAPLEMLANGNADLVEARPDQILEARSSGAPFVSVALLTTTPIDGTVKATPAPTRDRKGKARKVAPVPAPAVLATTEEFASNSGSIVRRLVQAAGRACASPAGQLKVGETALAASRKSATRAPQLDPPAGPPRISPIAGKPWGWQPPSDWTALVASLRASGKISTQGAPNTAWTNEFLAGEGT